MSDGSAHRKRSRVEFDLLIIPGAEALGILCLSDFCEWWSESEKDAYDVVRCHFDIASDHAYDYIDRASTRRVLTTPGLSRLKCKCSSALVGARKRTAR